MHDGSWSQSPYNHGRDLLSKSLSGLNIQVEPTTLDRFSKWEHLGMFLCWAGLKGHQAESFFPWVKTNGTILVGRCTTLFRIYFSGDWDVHWGHGILTHTHIASSGSLKGLAEDVAFQFEE